MYTSLCTHGFQFFVYKYIYKISSLASKCIMCQKEWEKVAELSLFINGKKHDLNLPSGLPLAPINIEWKLVQLECSQ